MKEQPKYPCISCIYKKECGSTGRTEYCEGRKTKSEVDKNYKVTFSGGIGNEYFMSAPNKTLCRKIFDGMTQPEIKIVKIEEVK